MSDTAILAWGVLAGAAVVAIWLSLSVQRRLDRIEDNTQDTATYMREATLGVVCPENLCRREIQRKSIGAPSDKTVPIPKGPVRVVK